MTSSFRASDVLELLGDETGGANPLASFWHSKRAGLDGVTVIRRTGTRSARERQIEEADLPRLALEAERAMRRYIAESEACRRTTKPVRVPRRRRDFRADALHGMGALVLRLRSLGIDARDIQRTIRKTTPFTILEVMRAASARGSS